MVAPDTDWFSDEVLSVNRKSLRSLSSAHDKWGQKKSVAFIIFFSIYICCSIYLI